MNAKMKLITNSIAPHNDEGALDKKLIQVQINILSLLNKSLFGDKSLNCYSFYPYC